MHVNNQNVIQELVQYNVPSTIGILLRDQVTPSQRIEQVPLLYIPKELMMKIFDLLLQGDLNKDLPHDLGNVSFASKSYCILANQDSLWQKFVENKNFKLKKNDAETWKSFYTIPHNHFFPFTGKGAASYSCTVISYIGKEEHFDIKV